MHIDNPALRLRQTPPLCAEDETLKVSASGGVVLTSKPAMDVVSVQQRPDMVSPCPRCQSLDTKFCYFNNHNVKQPRHFCRRCQRYWTAGGALRNVPVGAGRRKHKTPLISTASNLSHPEENALVGAAAGMCYSSSKTAHVLLTPPHTDGAQPHSCESVAAMSAHVGTDARQKEGNLGSLGHHTGAFYGVRRGAGQFKHSEEASSTNALPGSYNEKAVNQVALKSTPSPSPSHRSLDIEKMGLESSASTPLATDQRMGIAHPLGWLEQLGKANPTVPSESMQRAYGNASLSAWNHPLMWPWLMPYAAPTNGPMCNNMDQAMASAAWACAVTATAANILQTSPLWNPYGWGRDVNKSEISSLGKHGRSSLQEQEPLRVPKTLKIGDPDEAMHSSILTTLGLSSLSASSSASVTGFFNTSLEPKPAVWQHKLMVELPQHRHCEPPRAHGNPAAQARSLVFQESS